MEEKQKFPTATGFSGKILIASLFILSGILLFARNMGWITSEVFDMIVSWHSLLIILGIYSMIRRIKTGETDYKVSYLIKIILNTMFADYFFPPLFCFSIMSCTKLFIYISRFVYWPYLSIVFPLPSEAS